LHASHVCARMHDACYLRIRAACARPSASQGATDVQQAARVARALAQGHTAQATGGRSGMPAKGREYQVGSNQDTVTRCLAPLCAVHLHRLTAARWNNLRLLTRQRLHTPQLLTLRARPARAAGPGAHHSRQALPPSPATKPTTCRHHM
jgi:hypothetical protein